MGLVRKNLRVSKAWIEQRCNNNIPGTECTRLTSVRYQLLVYRPEPDYR